MTEIIDCIFVSAEPFTEPGRRDRSPQDCFRYCLEVNVYAERLTQFGFGDHEVPRPLLHVHRATELVLRTEPMDDLEDFLVEIKWSKTVMEETIEALAAIGADDHAGFLAGVHAHLTGLGYDIKRSQLIRSGRPSQQQRMSIFPPKRWSNAMAASALTTTATIWIADGVRFVCRP